MAADADGGDAPFEPSERGTFDPEAAVTSVSGAVQVLHWHAVARTCAVAGWADDAEAVAALAQHCMLAMRHYHSKRSLEAMLKAATAAAAHEPFVRALAAALLRPERAPRLLTPAMLETHVRLSCVVVPRVLAAAKAFSAVVGLQRDALHRLTSGAAEAHHGPAGGPAGRAAARHARSAAAAVGRMLFSCPEAVPRYIETFFASDSPGPDVVPISGAVVAACCAPRAPGPALLAAHRAQLVKQLAKTGLGAEVKPPPAAEWAYAPLLKVLTPADFADTLAPALARTLRRSPELTLSAVAWLASGVPAGLDLSPHLLELLTPLLPIARAADEPQRAAAAAAARALAARVADPAAAMAAFEAIKAILGGSEGRLGQSSQRAGMHAALGALAAAAPGRSKAASALASMVLIYLAGAYKDEMNEEVKIAIMCTVGAWLPRTGAEPPPAAALTALGAGVKEAKEPLRKATATAVLAALRAAGPGGGDLRPALGPALAAPLGTLARTALPKAITRAEGVAALAAAARLAAADSALDAALAKDKVWASVLAAESPLIAAAGQAAMLARLSPEEALPLVDLVEMLPGQFAHRLAETAKQAPPAGPALAALHARLLLHPAGGVRRAAGAAARRAAAEAKGAGALEAALDGFDAILRELEEAAEGSAAAGGAEQAKPAAGAEDGAAGGAEARVPPSRLAAALLALAGGPRAEPLPLATAGRLLLLAHRPLVAGGRSGRGLAKALLLPGARPSPQLPQRVAAAPGELAEALLGPRGLGAARAPEQAAAVAALATAAALFGGSGPALPALLERLGPWVDRSEHDSLSENDVKVYYTPAGQLANDPSAGVYIAEVVVDRNVRKARGRMRGGGGAFGGIEYSSDEDDAPARAAPAAAAGRPSTAGGRGGAGAAGGRKPEERKDPKAELREKMLLEEAATRARVAALAAKLALGLRGVAALAAGGMPSGVAHGLLPALMAPVAPLLGSPVVGDGPAFGAALQLARCLRPARVAAEAYPLTAALRLAARGEAAATGAAGTSPVKDSLAMLTRVCREAEAAGEGAPAAAPGAAAPASPLPAASYGLVFPILQHLLRAPAATALHDDALAVLGLHAAPGLDVPRPAALALLYHVLAVMPARAKGLLPLMQRLCAGLEAAAVPGALDGLLADAPHVRAACLAALPSAPALAAGALPADPKLAARLWLAKHDPDAANAAAASEIWARYPHGLVEGYAPELLAYLSSTHASVREAGSRALAAAMADAPAGGPETLRGLFALYGAAGSWEGRSGVALALKEAAGRIALRDLPVVITFLASRGLGDFHDEVRAQMVAAGAALVEAAGPPGVPALLPVLERQLEKPASSIEEDRLRAGCVVLLGALAKHLPGDDPKVPAVVDRLVAVLTTPSEAVQREVATCLPPLMPGLAAGGGERAAALVRRLIDLVLQAESYGHRRGGAFGLAGVVKGLGISSLKAHGVMDALKAAVEDKASARAREGALFAFECLSEKLGRLFEPYVIHILPMLLVCFGDGASAVRDATVGAAKAIMGQLSGQGVKLVLPALLKGLDDRAWRTKQGSVQLLGSMAYCAPRQLSTCLPTIVPKLTEVLSDTHPKVQGSAEEALQQVGGVVRNPEILRLVPALLAALTSPNEQTHACLDTLLETVFVNTVDAPSLALIVPVIHRGLRERSTEVKKKAAKITGNMCSLITEPKDMVPYVPLLLPELKKVLVDPIPEVRAIAAKAIASLIRGMGDESFREVLPWLLAALQSEASGVERSGAAQGLSEVIAALGTSHLEALLPEILENCRSARAAVRDGHMLLFVYLPAALGAAFQPYLGAALPRILDGLADENEAVRDAAMASGKAFVDRYARSSLPLLLPAVQVGLSSDNWRIRQSSVELLGELLFRVAGTTGRVQIDGGSDDEGASTEAQGRAVLEALGLEKRNEVLAAVYMARADVGLTVRSASLHVWKTLVTNTPRTLKEMLPELMRQVIDALACASAERRATAARCLGELVRKLGDRVLPSIIPILQAGLANPAATTRQGVCLGLSEVLTSASKSQLQGYTAELLPTVKLALCDRVEAVREAAGMAFNTLFKTAGHAVIEEVIPALLADIATDPNALDALKQILKVQKAILPAILPRLVEPPATAFRGRTLASLAEVAGAALQPYTGMLLPPLLVAMAAAAADEPVAGSAPVDGAAAASSDPAEVAAREASAAALTAAETVVRAVDGAGGLVPELMRSLNEPEHRVGAAHLTGFLCKWAPADMEPHLGTFVSALLPLFAEEEPRTVRTAWRALGEVTNAIPKEALPTHVRGVREAIQTAKDRERRKKRPAGAPPGLTLPGLRLPKALAPVLPVLLAGVLSGGSGDAREAAAEALGELVELTSDEALKPFVIAITGPLIRIVGDKFAWQVKAAILGALLVLVRKAGPALKPFLPQLQTTFVKGLQDAARPVRARAASALGVLSALNPRVDPLVGDLMTAVKAGEGGVREAVLRALRGVLSHAGAAVSPPVLQKAVAGLQETMALEDDEARAGAAGAVGIAARFLPDDQLDALLAAVCGPAAGAAWGLRYAHVLLVSAAVRHTGDRLCAKPDRLKRVVGFIAAQAGSDKIPVREAAAQAAGRLLCHQLAASAAADAPTSLAELLPVLLPLLADEASDVRLKAAHVLKRAAKADAAAAAPRFAAFYGDAFEALLVAAEDRISPVRLAAERAAMYMLQLHLGAAPEAAAKYVKPATVRKLERLPISTGSDDERSGDEAD